VRIQFASIRRAGAIRWLTALTPFSYAHGIMFGRHHHVHHHHCGLDEPAELRVA